jgi:hypothetical protein
MLPELESLGSIPLAVAGVAWLFAAAWGAGGWIVPLGVASRTRTRDATLLRLAVGVNLVALIGVSVAQLQWLAAPRSLWLLSALCLWSVPQCWRWWRRRRAGVAARKTAPWVTLAALLPLALTLGPALCYPTGWDELVYHGVLPRRWLADGFPAVYFDLPYSGFPSLGEVLFWAIAPLESVIAPRLIVWACWFLGVLLLHRVLRRALSHGIAVLTTGAFALSPATLMISANCYVESILFMNVVALLLAVQTHRRHPALPMILGVLAGGAAAVKLTGLVVLALPVFWFVAFNRISSSRKSGRKRNPVPSPPSAGERVRVRGVLEARSPLSLIGMRERGPDFGSLPVSLRVSLLVSFLVSLVVCGPFYLRPWLATGNPFYPYFAQAFSSDPARLAMSRYHHELGDAVYGVRSLETFLEAPVLLAVYREVYDGSLGWQWLVILALAAAAVVMAIRERRCRCVAWPLAVTMWMYVFWYITAQQARFAVPGAAALVVVAGVGLRQLPPSLRRVALPALLLGTVVSLPWGNAGYYVGSWEIVFGRQTWTGSVDESTHRRYIPLVRAIVERTPPDAKLMLLFEHRSLYVPREAIIGTPYFQEEGLTPPEDFATAAPLLELLRRNGVTHLVMATSPLGPDWAPAWWDRLQPVFRGIQLALNERRLHIVWQSDDYVVMEVR